MTDQEINIAIAELCGKRVCTHGPDKWEQEGTDGDSELFCTACEGYLRDLRCPKYCSDLNLMHESEELRIEPYDIRSYASNLASVVGHFWFAQGKATIKFADDDWHYAISHATARQRAEALLRTLDKWKE